MKASSITPLLLGIFACSSPGGEHNPRQLWLANDMVETRVKLVDVEPDPF